MMTVITIIMTLLSSSCHKFQRQLGWVMNHDDYDHNYDDNYHDHYCHDDDDENLIRIIYSSSS